MHEEVNHKTVALSIKASKLTARVLKEALDKFLEAEKKKTRSKNPYAKGKQSLKQLVGQNAGATNIEISLENIKSFEHVAKKYKIDYAVKKVHEETPRYLVFFKARDTDMMTMAFKEFVKRNEKKQTQPSIMEKLKVMKEQIRQGINRERSREHKKERGQVL